MKENALRNAAVNNAVMRMSRMATKVWIVPSVRRKVVSVDKRWFRACVTEVLGSANNSTLDKF